MKHWMAWPLLLAVLLLLACGEEASRAPDGDDIDGDDMHSDGDGPPTDGDDDPYTPERQDLEANGVLENVDGTAIRYSLVKGAPTAENDWDLMFDGWTILTNGGVSGNASGGGVPMAGIEYDALRAADLPPMPYHDSHGSVFDDWYAYTEALLTSKQRVYLIRADGQIYKTQILSYYGEVAGAPVAAMYAIKYAGLGEDGPGETQLVEKINGTAGGLEAQGDAGYFSFSEGKLRELTDSQAANSTRWHLRFKRFDINLNGGLSGPGDVAGYALTTSDFDSVSLDDAPDAEAFEEDRLKPVVDRWAQLDENGHLVFADYVYAILAADGQTWFKFYPLALSSPTESGYTRIEFRFDPLPQ